MTKYICHFFPLLLKKDRKLPVHSCIIHHYSVLWCLHPLLHLIITFFQYPGLNRGTRLKGQGLYPLGYCNWRLHGVCGIFFLWVLTFRYHKGPPIIRNRFESCYDPHWQVRMNSHAHTLLNIPPTISDVNLNLKLKPKPGIWLYTSAWRWPQYIMLSHGCINILVVFIIFGISYIFER